MNAFGATKIVHKGKRRLHELEKIVHKGKQRLHELEKIVHKGKQRLHELEKIVHEGKQRLHELELKIHFAFHWVYIENNVKYASGIKHITAVSGSHNLTITCSN